jgi:hypothetical protein
MRARLESRNRQLGVRRVRRGDHDDVEPARKQLTASGKGAAAILARPYGGRFRVVRGDPDELDIAERRNRVEVHLRGVAGADQAVAKRHASDLSAAMQSRVASSPLPSRT